MVIGTIILFLVQIVSSGFAECHIYQWLTVLRKKKLALQGVVAVLFLKDEEVLDALFHRLGDTEADCKEFATQTIRLHLNT
jgi:hypothetical protein